jgi:hypothetical protein
MMATATPDLEHARRFLQRFDAEANFFTLQTFDDGPEPKRKALAKIVHADPANGALDTLAGLNVEQRAGVFFTVNATDGKGREAHNVERVRAVFADLDGPPLEPVLTAGLDPHIVVESSPGKYHVYWFVDDCPLDEFRRVQVALARRFNGDPDVHDLPRVLRVPGFLHQKPANEAKGHTGEPFVSRVLDGVGTNAPPYSLAEIVGELGLELDAPRALNEQPPAGAPQSFATDEQLRELRSALAFIPADDRDLWIRIGHALKTLGDHGRGLWIEWSQTSDKWQSVDAHKWVTFKPTATSFQAVFAEAQRRGWPNPLAGRAGQAPRDDREPVGTETPGNEHDAPTGLHSRLVPLDNLDDAQPAPHFVESILPADEVTLLGGHGGLGKSYVALLLGLHLAAGRAFGPLAVQQTRVLFYSSEDGAATLRYRVKRLCDALGIDPAHLAGRLHLLDMADVDAALHRETVCYVAGEKRIGLTTSTLAQLGELVQQLAPGVVIIDGASDTYDDDEVSRARVRAFIRSIRQRLARPGRAVLLLAHVNKVTAKAGAEVSAEAYSGSTAWHNSVRSRLALTGEPGGQLTLTHQKANHGPIAEPLPIEFRDGVPTLAGTGPHPAAEFLARQRRELDRRDQDALLALIGQFEARGERVTTSATGSSTVYRLLRGEPEFPESTGPDRLMRLLRGLESAGRLFRCTVRTPDRKHREVFRTTPESAPMPPAPGSADDVDDVGEAA